MFISHNQTSESHIKIDNKIKTANRLIIQTCRVYTFKNRSCFVTTEMSNKCVFYANTSKIIKQCEVLSINYIMSINNNDLITSFKNIVVISFFTNQTTSSSRQTIRRISHSSQTSSIQTIASTFSRQQIHSFLIEKSSTQCTINYQQ